MRLLPAIMVAAFSGYIAISYEIIWLRTFSFAMESKADSFGLLLGAYLGGLAIGAHGAGLICRSIAKTRVLMLLVGLLLAANTAAFLVVPGMMACAEFCQNERNMDLVLVAVATALLGMALPVTAHAAVAPDKGAGRGISFIYCGNILGSVSGGLITGFWLFDVLNLTQNAFLLTLSGLVATSLIVLTAQLS
ncbi:MAG: hypothetical protein HN478_08430, partial [Rhodospirillaceae bacterium]|nr:hypothetical protein [Rhodospirillaceae bacterium]